MTNFYVLTCELEPRPIKDGNQSDEITRLDLWTEFQTEYYILSINGSITGGATDNPLAISFLTEIWPARPIKSHNIARGRK